MTHFYGIYTLVHYSDISMSAMASQITSILVIYSTICSGAYQGKHQSSLSLGFVRKIHQWLVTSLYIGPVMQKMFPWWLWNSVLYCQETTCFKQVSVLSLFMIIGIATWLSKYHTTNHLKVNACLVCLNFVFIMSDVCSALKKNSIKFDHQSPCETELYFLLFWK